ncbi:MAG: NUDIX hydrolase [Terriglobales bacterium]
MEREFSAGGVVVRRMRDRWWMAAIEPQVSKNRRARTAKATRVLALPKGLIDKDKGETPAETAVREVREETGVAATLVSKLIDIRYVYVRSWGDKQRVFKVVSFYLLLYRSGRLDDLTPDMRKEVRCCEWIPLDEAPRKLTYKGERDVAKLALDYVASHPALAASKTQAASTVCKTNAEADNDAAG